MTRLVATLPRRIAACVVDAAIPIAAAGVLWMVLTAVERSTGRDPGSLMIPLWLGVLALGWALILSAMQGGVGSPGMRLFGVRLLGAADLRPIGFERALWRNVVWTALCFVAIGFFTPLFDRSGNRQGWHDRAANVILMQRGRRTVVLPAVPPRDVRASEWLAAMSIPAPADTGPITDVPLSTLTADLAGSPDPRRRTNHLIDIVPGITGDRRELERLLQAQSEGAAMGPVQAARVERARVAQAARASRRADQQTEEVDVEAPYVAPRDEEFAAAEASRDADVAAAVGTTDDELRVRARTPSRDDASAETELNGGAATPSSSAAPEPPTPPASRNLDEETVASAPPSSRIARELTGLRAVATLVWDDGSQFRVYTRTVFGRNPEPEGRAQLATIFDNSLSLSKTHFSVARTENDGVQIIDLNSTNGVAVRRDGASSPLVPGQPLLLRSGDILEIGSRRARIEVMS